MFDYFIVYVRVFGPELMELPNYHVYKKVGSKWAHPLSHWATFATVYRIQQICEEFFNRTGITAGINDISLPWGGRFDLGPEYDGLWWASPDLPPFSLPVVIWKAGFHSTCPAIPPEPPVA
ncbi:MAG: hypothetical protein ACOYX1_14410 [Acidobacteriota bacterium]